MWSVVVGSNGKSRWAQFDESRRIKISEVGEARGACDVNSASVGPQVPVNRVPRPEFQPPTPTLRRISARQVCCNRCGIARNVHTGTVRGKQEEEEEKDSDRCTRHEIFSLHVHGRNCSDLP